MGVRETAVRSLMETVGLAAVAAVGVAEVVPRWRRWGRR